MATSDELADLHRRAQARLGVLTVAEVAALWRMIDVDDLDGSAPGWIAAALGVVTLRREQSASLARRFLREYRRLVLPNAEPVPPAPPTAIPTAAILTSLRVTGPVAFKSALARGVTRTDAAKAVITLTSRSAERHALDGGVEVITSSTEQDRRAHGWRRDRSGGACDFCSAPANQEGSGAFRRHDGCHCNPVPVYR